MHYCTVSKQSGDAESGPTQAVVSGSCAWQDGGTAKTMSKSLKRQSSVSEGRQPQVTCLVRRAYPHGFIWLDGHIFAALMAETIIFLVRSESPAVRASPGLGPRSIPVTSLPTRSRLTLVRSAVCTEPEGPAHHPIHLSMVLYGPVT